MRGLWSRAHCRRRTAAVWLAFAGLLLILPERALASLNNGDWTFTKTANPTTYTAAGQVITYTYTVTSKTGATGLITSLTDDKVTIPAGCTAGPVPPNGTVTCTATYTITAADVTAGSVVNNANVKGDSCRDGCDQDLNAQATITLDARPSWTLSKSANPTTYTAAGQSIGYSYLLTNTGNVTINSISITDNKVSPVGCPSTSLAAGANMTCTGTYTTTASDVSTGSVTNSATANGTPAGGTLQPVSAQATITFLAQPSWTLNKTPNPTTYTAAGQAIGYSYLLSNTGNVTINSISITDDKLSPVSCTATSLAPGANMTCTGTYTTTASDTSSGSVTNHATAKGTPTSGTLPNATAQATVTFSPQPSWTLSKTPNPTTYTAAGQAIGYSYLLSNTGNVTINSISITDNKVSPVSCPATTLAAGANMTCSGAYTTTASDVSSGSVTNTATASGTPTGGTLQPVTAQATIRFAGQPAWTLSKTANPATYTAAGQAIGYSYLLTNSGSVTINSISITDNKVSPVSCPAATLAPGANMTCTGTYTTTASDVSSGSVTNTATANGTPSSGTLQPATAQATITFAGQPAWTLTKTPSPTTYTAAGQAITYSYLLTNTGNVAISAISLTDSRISAVSCPATSLAAGANMTCTAIYTTTVPDVTAGSVTNTATATGTPAAGSLQAVTARATINFRPPATGSITIIKSATGGNETFNFASTITGAASFALTTAGGTASRTFSNLTPGIYTVTEVNLPLNWRLATLSCAGDTGGVPTTVDVGSRSVSIGLDGGEAITCTFNNLFDVAQHRGQTQEVIYRFLAHRLQLLASDEPDRSRLIRRLPGVLWGDEEMGGGFGARGGEGPFTLTGNSSALSSNVGFSTSLSRIAQAHEDVQAKNENGMQTALAYATPVKAPPRAPAPASAFDVWAEGHFSQFKADDRGISNSGSFGILYLGADYLLTSSILVGALVQFDRADERSRQANSAVSGTGWMAGPYMSARLTPNVFFDARTAWGTSSNKVDPFGLYQDSFATNRWLARANLTGNWRFGDFRVTPSAALTYVQEKQLSYVDTLSVLIPSQTVALGRFDAGPEFAYRFFGSNGAVYEPHIGVKGVWDFRRPDAASVDGLIVTGDEFSMRLETGLLARAANGWSFRTVVAYDGVGSSHFHNIGAKIWVNVPFH